MRILGPVARRVDEAEPVCGQPVIAGLQLLYAAVGQVRQVDDRLQPVLVEILLGYIALEILPVFIQAEEVGAEICRGGRPFPQRGQAGSALHPIRNVRAPVNPVRRLLLPFIQTGICGGRLHSP